MARNKPPKRMFKNTDRVSSYEAAPNSEAKRLKTMSRDHQDVLQNVEFAVVTQWREDRGIDDRHVDMALTAALGGGTPSDRRVEDLIGAIAMIRSTRTDVSDELWRTAILTIRDSVRAHSQRKPGERSYLEFVSPYIR